jgi:hypothetical protein
MGNATAIADNLTEVHRRIAEAAKAAGRDASDIELVAVSKMQPDPRIEAALAAGHRRFGENRVQEAEARWPGRRAAHPDLTLHLIGPLQTNKVKAALGLFDVIESLDRPKLARALAKEVAGGAPAPEVLIQVNTGEEPQKAGVPPAELADLLTLCRDELGLAIAGLMCIPPVDDNPALHFALLDELARRHGLAVRSMGMSGDYETAIRHGATRVRVGTGVFGARDYGD